MAIEIEGALAIATQIEEARRFKSVSVIGAAGQVGELFTKTLSLIPGVKIEPVLRGGVSALEKKPEVIILATPNPIEKALEQVAKYAKYPSTLVLPQNGVGIGSTAQKVLAESAQITIVRASLFTTVSRDQDGNLVYDGKRQRIALAPVGDNQAGKIERAADLFQAAGFDVRVVADHRSMEWAKLIGNLFGSTSSVTGLTPFETFSDPEFADIEHKALRRRFEILYKAGIKPADLWGIGQLRLFSRVPGFVGRDRGLLGKTFRRYVAKKIAAERNNQPSAAARQIAEGASKVEPTGFYHPPIIDLGNRHGLESPVDSAILDILRRHEDSKDVFSLNFLSEAEKRRFFLETYKLETKEVFVNGVSILGVEPLKILIEGMYNFYLDSLNVSGKEHLRKVADTLKGRKSVLIVPEHRSHSDHPTVVKALRENLPPEVRGYPIYIVAGMKFDQEDLSGKFNRAYPHPVVWTVTESDTDEIQWRAKIINKRARRIIGKLLKEPCIFVVYLEGGRNKSADLALQPPAMHSSWWVLNPKFGLVVPTVITGTEKMLPPGEQWPHPADIAIEFCEPIGGDELAELRNERRKLPSERWDRDIAGRVMRRIAEKLPHHQRGGY